MRLKFVRVRSFGHTFSRAGRSRISSIFNTLGAGTTRTDAGTMRALRARCARAAHESRGTGERQEGGGREEARGGERTP